MNYLKYITTFQDWIASNYAWIASIFVQSFIAYHLFFLSRKLSLKGKLEHKEKIKQKADKLVSEIHNKNLNNKVYLVNINRYFKDYPANQEKIFSGYSHIRAKIKETVFDGIDFFSSMPVQIYRNSNKKLSLKGSKEEEAFLAYPVSTVPYEWIEFIDLSGDEYDYVPLIYCHFKGSRYWKKGWKGWRKFLPFGYPYKNTIYYRRSNVYNEGSDPPSMKYTYVEESIK